MPVADINTAGKQRKPEDVTTERKTPGGSSFDLAVSVITCIINALLVLWVSITSPSFVVYYKLISDLGANCHIQHHLSLPLHITNIPTRPGRYVTARKTQLSHQGQQHKHSPCVAGRLRGYLKWLPARRATVEKTAQSLLRALGICGGNSLSLSHGANTPATRRPASSPLNRPPIHRTRMAASLRRARLPRTRLHLGR
jgi:hypothetical protein